jgi:hypothetical protein
MPFPCPGELGGRSRTTGLHAKAVWGFYAHSLRSTLDPDQTEKETKLFDPRTNAQSSRRLRPRARRINCGRKVVSNLNLFSDGERVVNLDTKISDSAFQLRVSKQKLDRT